MTARVVIFNYKAIFTQDAAKTDKIRECLEALDSLGIKICVFSTDERPIIEAMESRGYPKPICVLFKSDPRIGVNRGSHKWVDAVVDELDIDHSELVYIGLTKWDWYSAVNSGTLYAHAKWITPQPGGTTSLVLDEPEGVVDLIRQFLLSDDKWSYVLSDASRNFRLRALLPASATLPSTKPGTSFTLQKVFTYEDEVLVGESTARDLLMLHALTCLYSEGIAAKRSFFCIYPSSKLGKVSEQLEGYLRHAVSIFGSSYKDDLLVRAVEGVDTSLARVRASRGQSAPDVSIANQASTVVVNKKYQGRLAGKTVIVFDDFTTSGMSLEWARNLLLAAGADNIVMLAIGKYGPRYKTYNLKPGRKIDPFNVNDLTTQDFAITEYRPVFDSAVESRLSGLLAEWIADT